MGAERQKNLQLKVSASQPNLQILQGGLLCQLCLLCLKAIVHQERPLGILSLSWQGAPGLIPQVI